MYDVKVQLHSFAHGYPVVPVPLVEKTVYVFRTEIAFVKNQMTINVRVYF